MPREEYLHCHRCGGTRAHEDRVCAMCGLAKCSPSYKVMRAVETFCATCGCERLMRIYNRHLATCGTCGLPVILDPPIS